MDAASPAKALYRYAVADCPEDALRMFKRLLRHGSIREILRGGVILLLGLTKSAKTLEKVRITRLLRVRFRCV